MTKVYVIHENEAWVEPLRARFAELGTPYEEWNLVEGTVPIDEAPPPGVFYNRMSASSYTRGHRYSPEYTAVVLSWLEAHGRRVANGSRALSLEINKAAQYQALRLAGIDTPKTIVAVGVDAIMDASKQFEGRPFILKPNRGGKGDGVRLMHNIDELSVYLHSPAYETPVDGITMVQEFIESADKSIVRAEFIGGEFFYAVRVETGGAFELCPADVCQLPDEPSGPSFTVLDGNEGVPLEMIRAVQKALAINDVDVAGVEFIQNTAGHWYAYDINTNTNYNAEAEYEAGLYGMQRLAAYLTDALTEDQAYGTEFQFKAAS